MEEKSKVDGVIYKLDFVRAFDKLNIDYLLKLFKFTGFQRDRLGGYIIFFSSQRWLLLSMVMWKNRSLVNVDLDRVILALHIKSFLLWMLYLRCSIKLPHLRSSRD